ncbi:N-acetylmuramoyl-L-alanine amidase [Staphylococcus gallinarum]|uniref:N-acetylmuramoyl-L-alanine amidase n=1 Tax=Staphylococcus gallinarum TaxID=1293 RepID=UPI001E64FC46|nr:N-acetylmuramoyl-L-alanine amidase [Staphylococcus gallinarum]MDN6414447.1 N-acetylmuramoyl-L-alanine amidase [Staphylococcus gallinarum]
MYQDIAYGQRVGNHKDYGLYWVKSQGYETVVEFYLDSAGPTATGAHTIIPSGYPANTIDKNIQNALKNTVGVIRGVTECDDLLNCNVVNDIGIDYRLVELGFITTSKDMNYIINNLKSFTKKSLARLKVKRLVVLAHVK